MENDHKNPGIGRLAHRPAAARDSSPPFTRSLRLPSVLETREEILLLLHLVFFAWSVLMATLQPYNFVLILTGPSIWRAAEKRTAASRK